MENELLNNLSGITKTDTEWKVEAEFLVENKAWLDDSLRIASLILSRMRNLGWKQIDLATTMGVTPQQVSKWVKGRENFRLSTLKRLEKALGIDILEIQDQDDYSLKTISYTEHLKIEKI